MSGRVGLREEARLGHLLARRIARLFDPQRLLAEGKVKGAQRCR
jgi:hypothetical protein